MNEAFAICGKPLGPAACNPKDEVIDLSLCFAKKSVVLFTLLVWVLVLDVVPDKFL